MDFSTSVSSLDSFDMSYNAGPLGQATWAGLSIGSSIAFIDGSLANYQSISNSLMPGTDIVVLDSSGDELLQITAELAGRSNLSSVAIFSHGSAGSLLLGGTIVDGGLLSSYSDSIQSWANAFTADADILLYGCNVAEGDVGAAFTQDLSFLTGADVAASTDLTGAESLGGNWTLESVTGTIETADFFTSDYQGVLANYLVNNLLDDYSDGSLRLAIAIANSDVNPDVIIFDPNLTGTIQLTAKLEDDSRALQIIDDLTIVGNGKVTIDAQFSSRVFEVAPVNVVLRDLIIANGKSSVALDGAGAGGAIINFGNLSLVNSDIINSQASKGGGVFSEQDSLLTIRGGNFKGNQALVSLGGVGSGGAIFNNGSFSATTPTSLAVTLTSFTNNSADNDGGAILNASGRTASFDVATFDKNKAINGSGGAIFNAARLATPTMALRGAVTVSNSIMIGNTAKTFGGAICNLGLFTSDNTLISGSSALSGGGALANRGNLSIATIKNTSMLSNTTNGNGGAILNEAGGRVTLQDGSFLSSNKAQGLTSQGGGIFNAAPASRFRIVNSTVLSNKLTLGTNKTGRGVDLRGAFTSGGSNLIGDSRGSSGFIDGVNGDSVLVPVSFATPAFA
jgi:predicted outer membrane repeat protein